VLSTTPYCISSNLPAFLARDSMRHGALQSDSASLNARCATCFEHFLARQYISVTPSKNMEHMSSLVYCFRPGEIQGVATS